MFFDEALTNSPALTRYCPPTTPGQFFQTRGGSLGVGIPGAIGAKLAMPDKTVIGVTGDGGAMYTIQALWSAARHNVGAKFIICNNRSYRLLQLNISAYWKEQHVAPHDFPLSFDLSKPELNFAAMAQSMGVPGLRVETPRRDRAGHPPDAGSRRAVPARRGPGGRRAAGARSACAAGSKALGTSTNLSSSYSKSRLLIEDEDDDEDEQEC